MTYANRKKEIIYLDERLHTNESLHLAMLGITNPTPQYLICHSAKTNTLWNRYNFEFVLSGKGYIETKGKKYTVEAGDLFFLNKFREHTYYSDMKDPYEKMFIVVEGGLVDNLIAYHNLTESVVIKHVQAKHLFERLFELAKTHNTSQLDSLCYAEIASTLIELLQIIKPLPFTTISPDSSPERVMYDYIENNLYSKIRVEDVANVAHLSVSYAQKIFKQKFSKPILRYIMDKKLQLAQHLFLTTYLNVNTVSERLSFENPKHFSKMFKQKYGLSPSKYIKENTVNKNKETKE